MTLITGDRPPPSFEFQTMLTNAADASSYTFTSVPLGTPKPFRHIICHVLGPTTTVSIGGVAATELVPATSIFGAHVPTGSTGTIVATGASLRAIIAVYAVYGLKSLTPADSFVTTAGNIDVPAKGIVFANAFSGSSSNISWTGLTERGETTVEAFTLSTAADVFPAGGTITVGRSPSGNAYAVSLR